MTGFALQALDFLHHRGNGVFTRWDIGVEADDALRFCHGFVWNTCWNEGALAGRQFDDPAPNQEPAPPGKNKCDLILFMEVRRQSDVPAMHGAQLHNTLCRRTPVSPSSAR